MGTKLNFNKPAAPKAALAPDRADAGLTQGAPILNWADDDIENRFGVFRGGRYTSVNKLLTGLIGLVLAGVFFAVMVYLGGGSASAARAGGASPNWIQSFANLFVRPGNVWTTGPSMVLFFWAAMSLCFKNQKLKYQYRALDLAAVPQQPGFVLNEATARTVLERLHNLVDHPRHFILLNRIERALSNLHNIGGLGDVSTILKGQGENDENQIMSSYTLLNGMVWAIPVLGFIGTVLGLSMAIGTFTLTLASAGDLSAIKDNLRGVTSGLATAFETTLVGLVCALILQLWINFLQQKEADFLDECNDYCHSHVIAKLRLIERSNAS